MPGVKSAVISMRFGLSKVNLTGAVRSALVYTEAAPSFWTYSPFIGQRLRQFQVFQKVE